MSYTIWLIPEEEKVQAYFTNIIEELADKYNGPIFEAHTTLLGDLQLSLDEVVKGCESFASKTKPFKVEVGTVEYSTTYYQCIFARVKPCPELFELYDLTKKAFSLTEQSVFMPHISLFYGDMPYLHRQKIVDLLHLAPQQFTVKSAVIVPGGEFTPSEWEHLAEAKFI